MKVARNCLMLCMMKALLDYQSLFAMPLRALCFV